MAEERKALKGRFIRQRICTSRDVAELIEEFGRSGAWAGLLFERMLLFQDDDHRMIAETAVIRANCLPFHDLRLSKVEEFVRAMDKKGLIQLYSVNGTRYCFFPSGERHQPKPRPDRYYPSELPPPPDRQSDSQTGGDSAPLPDLTGSDLTGPDLNRRNGVQKEPPATPTENEILQALHRIPGWKPDPEGDLLMIRRLSKYPPATMLAVAEKLWATLKDKPGFYKSPRRAFLNWIEREGDGSSGKDRKSATNAGSRLTREEAESAAASWE